jgi:hypothetical protein
VQEYIAGLDAWVEKAPIATSRLRAAAAFLNGGVYAFGGLASCSPKASSCSERCAEGFQVPGQRMRLTSYLGGSKCTHTVCHSCQLQPQRADPAGTRGRTPSAPSCPPADRLAPALLCGLAVRWRMWRSSMTSTILMCLCTSQTPRQAPSPSPPSPRQALGARWLLCFPHVLRDVNQPH